MKQFKGSPWAVFYNIIKKSFENVILPKLTTNFSIPSAKIGR